MPQFKSVPLSEAPQPMSKARLAQQALYEGFITNLKSDEAGQLTPDADETTRVIKLRLNKAATALGRKIDVWDSQGDVFFKLSSPAKTGKRGRPRKQTD